ncbi:energy coupling factor transporter S component ThiW [Gracilibacillus alcaliphilus]|uniref:energy coupling factor transporter S component ThiW n=1 Tax=Gracilibacillus alcaliphilus TaxID=1401441 RepID=UPI001957257B|nr:energy coupling factor transporter S component ThiW [Gracilibacillus alcaliphilus]MBM7679036.1 energy coupling factor transporter S component ThiW [Gracilibacillus alcaliphilus]
MNRVLLLTTMAVLIAIGTLGSQFLWFPTGVARAYPVQHAVNVIAAVMLGPIPAVIIAFIIGLLRNLLGLGTLLAFPGGMIGALLAGLLYQWTKRKWAAGIGEMVGTGIIGSLLCVPYAKLLMGTSVGVLAFLPGFLVSSITGAIIGILLLSRVKHTSLGKQAQLTK